MMIVVQVVVMNLTIRFVSKLESPQVLLNPRLGFHNGSKGVGPVIQATVKSFSSLAL